MTDTEHTTFGSNEEERFHRLRKNSISIFMPVCRSSEAECLLLLFCLLTLARTRVKNVTLSSTRFVFGTQWFQQLNNKKKGKFNCS